MVWGIKKINIVIPMAGLGTRIRDAYKLPKPLIEVHGHPLLAWAIAGLPLHQANSITLITRSEIANQFNISDLIKPYIPKNLTIDLKVLNQSTSGQAETVMMGTSELPDEEPLLVFNCDTVVSDDFPDNPLAWDGLLGIFHSDDPSLSFVESDQNGEVTRTAEKQVISNKASTGLYYFAQKNDFGIAYSKTRHIKESYVAPLYNNLISENRKIGCYETKIFIPLGTSEEIEAFANSNIGENFMDLLVARRGR
jgi:NDP-sugar pyrophosphorylase family protein